MSTEKLYLAVPRRSSGGLYLGKNGCRPGPGQELQREHSNRQGMSRCHFLLSTEYLFLYITVHVYIYIIVHIYIYSYIYYSVYIIF